MQCFSCNNVLVETSTKKRGRREGRERRKKGEGREGAREEGMKEDEEVGWRGEGTVVFFQKIKQCLFSSQFPQLGYEFLEGRKHIFFTFIFLMFSMKAYTW